MTKLELSRLLDLLAYRADRLKPGTRRDALVARIECSLIRYALVLDS